MGKFVTNICKKTRGMKKHFGEKSLQKQLFQPGQKNKERKKEGKKKKKFVTKIYKTTRGMKKHFGEKSLQKQ